MLILYTTPVFFGLTNMPTRGTGRFEEEAAFAAEAVYKYSESQANSGRKRPYNKRRNPPFSADFNHNKLKLASISAY